MTSVLVILVFASALGAKATHSPEITAVKQVSEANGESGSCHLCLMPVLHAPPLLPWVLPPRPLWLSFETTITPTLETTASPHHVRPPPVL